jgi:hypothetical protein
MTQDTELDAIEAEKQRTADEQYLIEMLERLEGRKFTEQEINLSLDQARVMSHDLPRYFPRVMSGKPVCKKPLCHTANQNC